MLYRISLSLTIASLLATPLANAQDAEQAPSRFWKAKIPGGNYMVAMTTISSVSYHQYVIDGSLMVDEVTIDTTGNSLVRFYSISPLGEDSELNLGKNLLSRGKELIDQAGDRTGVNLNEVVVKQYPTTTHAKTVEYRLPSKQNVTQLYKSIAQAWERGRGGNFTVK